ncbi:histone lysine methyltransferase SET/SUV39 [Toxoplasma gondii ME49]|uniref:Histone lysine methyltransferase SET/SUV39 n=1 Tax=Toxoplasma gondii (strain ATCC 50611 / Me49) TaxID=508771 RepID=S8GKY1_TOXGM|nr:histone lysine methyltransferase SET/SUV39 [Toxoplasma gondii ME49]EPT29189.1 histone lysine methyltransferase SET/SUV39 [Toxoplasma gondii ME49]|eukprot:XP_018636944.1 histone lysine methyltransferase SET/SUV39 [Toxoplasma gondii ME49]
MELSVQPVSGQWPATVSGGQAGNLENAPKCPKHCWPPLSLLPRPRFSQPVHYAVRTNSSRNRETPGHEFTLCYRSSGAASSVRNALTSTCRACLYEAASQRRGPVFARKAFKYSDTESRGNAFPACVAEKTCRRFSPSRRTGEQCQFRPGVKRRREDSKENYNRVLSAALRSLYVAAQQSPSPYSPWRRHLPRFSTFAFSGRGFTPFFCHPSDESSAIYSPRLLSSKSSATACACCPPFVEPIEILDDSEQESEDVAVLISDLDSEEEKGRLHQLQQCFKERRRRTRQLRGVGKKLRAEKPETGESGKRKASDCVEEVDVRHLDMGTGVEDYEDFFQLNADEKALWLALKFIHLYQRCAEKVATPGSMSRALRKMKEMVENLFPSNVIGPGSLRVMPGFRCLYTGQLSAVGLHCSFNDRMCIGHDDESLPTVTSLLLNDDRVEDYNDIIIVYGEENDGKGYGAYPGDQMLFIGGTNTRNYSLWNAWKLEYPVRVVRGYKCKSKYAPSFGFRYDGLYRVVEMLADSNNSPCAFHPRSRSPFSPSPSSSSSPPSSPSSSSQLCSSPSSSFSSFVASGAGTRFCRRSEGEFEERRVSREWNCTEKATRRECLRSTNTEAYTDPQTSDGCSSFSSSVLSPLSHRRALSTRNRYALPARTRPAPPSPDSDADLSLSRSASRSRSFSLCASELPDRGGSQAVSLSHLHSRLPRGCDEEPRKQTDLGLSESRRNFSPTEGEKAGDRVFRACFPSRGPCHYTQDSAEFSVVRRSTSRSPQGGKRLRRQNVFASNSMSHAVSESPSPPRGERRSASSPRSSATQGKTASSCSFALSPQSSQPLNECRRQTSESRKSLDVESEVEAREYRKHALGEMGENNGCGQVSPGGAGFYAKRERQHLDGRRVFKFVLVSIHRDTYLPPESRVPNRDLAIFNHKLFEDDKGLKKVKALAYYQSRAHYKIQEQLQASLPSSLSRSTKVVQVSSDLPFRFAVAIPPVLKLPGQTQSILSNFLCIMAAAYKIYTEIKLAVDPAVSATPSGALLAVWKYQTAVSAFASPPPPQESSFSEAKPSAKSPIQSRFFAPSLTAVAPPCWALCGLLPLKLLLTHVELELRELSPENKARLVEQARVDCRRHPPGYLESKRDNALPSFSKTQEDFADLLVKLKNKTRAPGRHRPLVWTEGKTEILVTSELAKIFSHQLLPQSATCGIYSSIELCSPLPDSWSPWEDISQGREKFPVPAINDVDDLPPPVDFSYQVRNVCFSRLPNFCMLCLCAGCVPPDKDTSTWERIEVEGYSSGLRDPETGRVYCAGSNLSFIQETATLAVCTSYCLCDKSICRNRYPEDLAYPVMVAKTKLAGWELRTQVAIPSGAFIMQYVGEMMCRATMEGRSRHNSRRGYHNYCMEIVQDEWEWEDNWKLPCIDSLFLGNASRFLNHSCEPNVEVRNIWRGPLLPIVGVFSRRKINAGEALTYAYGSGYETIKCWCGTKACKGYIGDRFGAEGKEEGKRGARELRQKSRNATHAGAETALETADFSDDETKKKGGHHSSSKPNCRGR